LSKHAARKPLALAALLSTAVAGVVASAPAHATNLGLPAQSPLTVSDGSNQIQVVGGNATGAPTNVASVAWSPKGDRFAYVDGSGAVFTAKADGSGVVQIADADGSTRSHPAWDQAGLVIAWSEKSGTGPAQLRFTLSNGGWRGTAKPTVTPTGYDANVGDDTAPAFAGSVLVWQRGIAASGSAPAYTQVVARTFDANGNASVHVVDGKSQISGTTDVGSASQPTVNEAGQVAYVKNVLNQDGTSSKQIFTASVAAPAPQQVTFTTADHTDPALSPDGATVAYDVAGGSAGDGVYTSVLPAAGAASNTETKVSDHVGDLAYRTEFKVAVERLQGFDRFGTADYASQSQWRDNGNAGDGRLQASSAVLSRSDLYADALGGSALAAKKNGPLLLTPTDSLDQATAAELKRILAPGSTVYLLGGTGAISANVEASVRALGFTTKREAGADRYQTAVAIADESVPNPSTILLATGDDYPDALSAGAAAANDPGTVVVLTAGDTKTASVPQATRDYLNRFATSLSQSNGNVGVWTIGGPAEAAYNTLGAGWYYLPIRGTDRYATSLNLATTFFGDGTLTAVGVATGLNWPDALSGGAVVGSGDNYGPLLLVDPAQGLSPAAAGFLDQSRSTQLNGYVFGGYGVLPS
jgi:hypothetical protein